MARRIAMTTSVFGVLTLVAVLGVSARASANLSPVQGSEALLNSLVGGSAKLCDGGTWTCTQYLGTDQGTNCALQRQECGGCTPPTCLMGSCNPDNTLKKCGSPGTNCHGSTTCSGLIGTGTCQWAGIETANDCSPTQHWWLCTYGPGCIGDGGTKDCASTWGCW